MGGGGDGWRRRWVAAVMGGGGDGSRGGDGWREVDHVPRGTSTSRPTRDIGITPACGTSTRRRRAAPIGARARRIRSLLRSSFGLRPRETSTSRPTRDIDTRPARDVEIASHAGHRDHVPGGTSVRRRRAAPIGARARRIFDHFSARSFCLCPRGTSTSRSTGDIDTRPTRDIEIAFHAGHRDRVPRGTSVRKRRAAIAHRPQPKLPRPRWARPTCRDVHHHRVCCDAAGARTNGRPSFASAKLQRPGPRELDGGWCCFMTTIQSLDVRYADTEATPGPRCDCAPASAIASAASVMLLVGRG